MFTPLSLGALAILGTALIVPACAAEMNSFKAAHLAALASSKAADLPPPERTFTLAVISDATFFDGRAATAGDVIARVAGGMPENACLATSRKANAYAGRTACIAE